MGQHYSDPSRASDHGSLPDIETYQLEDADAAAEFHGFTWAEDTDAWLDCDGDEVDPAEFVGWYWWACLPGCMPTSDTYGPFETEAEAVADAQQQHQE